PVDAVAKRDGADFGRSVERENLHGADSTSERPCIYLVCCCRYNRAMPLALGHSIALHAVRGELVEPRAAVRPSTSSGRTACMDTVVITALDQEGRGVARVDGKAIFVEGALIGERVAIEVFRRKPNYELARMAELNATSSAR